MIVIGLLLIVALVSPVLAAAQQDLDWTIGTWQGVRRDAASGKEDPMTMRVEAILGGNGQIRHIEVPHQGGVYRGFAVQVYDADGERWVRQYVNEGRGYFTLLEGEVEGDRSVWKVATPGRKRESRLVSERPATDRWIRTMSVSEDGGKSWHELWIDELHKVSAEQADDG